MYGDTSGWADASVEEGGGNKPYPWGVKNLTIERPAVAVPQ